MPPIGLLPDNPRYFLFRGRPTVLITSAEHYGAVLNLDFDYVPYLEELGARGFDLTRIFSGAYCEDPASFGIEHNTLGPKPGRLICPWTRSTTDGTANGDAIFDLTRWDEQYFRRLRDFCTQAGERSIVVEYVFFCPFYNDAQWALSPLNATNNINGVGSVPKEEVWSLDHPDLVAVQEAMVRKVVAELAGFDNLYYEICNEPYQGGVTMEWQHHIADTIVEAEAALPARHLIAQNIANGSQKIADLHPAVSIFNFHYANPPATIALNWDLEKPIGFDESGFRGIEDLPYRTEAWEFIMAGGSIYNHLDYSFTCEHPDGTFRFTKSPGGGGSTLRAQLAILKRFIDGFDLTRLQPDEAVIAGGVPSDATAYALSVPGKAYAVYLKGGSRANLNLDIPPGGYHIEWHNPRTGGLDKQEDVTHYGGALTLASPPYAEDVALRLVAHSSQT